MGKGHVQIQILGAAFTIQADEDPDYLSRLVAYVSDKVQEIERTVTTKDPLRIAILAGLLLADELFKDRERLSSTLSPSESEEAERIARRLIASIDESLQEE
jgi:cell division protein ZapA (FtsZ GTPase activity inhibitor)